MARRKPTAPTRRSPATAGASPGPAAASPPCPCGLGAPYAACCGPFLAGREAAPTAERLMRSRYTAFARGDAAYLLRTWAAATRPADLTLDPGIRWTGLTVLGATGGSAFHSEGTVEFTARYRAGGRAGEQHENSGFVREQGLWVYVDALT